MNFTKRLRAAKEKAALTIKEMAIWFGGMSDQTMWSWLKGRIPKEYHFADAERNLGFLEKEIAKKGARLPLAIAVRQGERHQHVATIRKSYG